MSLSRTNDELCLPLGPLPGEDSAARDIPSMAATLTSYDQLFGPHHPQTLAVMGRLGRALWRSGDAECGRRLLERAAHGLSQRLPREHPARVFTLTALGEVLFELGDFNGSYLIQREVLECQRPTGLNHPDTVAAERRLAATLLELGRWDPANGSLGQT